MAMSYSLKGTTPLALTQSKPFHFIQLGREKLVKPTHLYWAAAWAMINSSVNEFYYLDSEWDNKMDKLEIVITKICSLGAGDCKFTIRP